MTAGLLVYLVYALLRPERGSRRSGSRLNQHQPAAREASWTYGRPSATTGTDPADPSKSVPQPYNAVNSGGSNLGPTSKALIDRVKADVDTLKQENPSEPVPQDLVTTSGSGLDPHISPEAAYFQVPRIAKVRNIPDYRVRQLIQERVEGRMFGLLGEPRVNVLALNLALDRTPAQ